MPLAEGQWQIRDLLMGPGTPYRLMDDTNPFTISARADEGGPRAWNHGSWSGAEWANERVVPLRLLVDTAGGDTAAWLGAHQPLAAAFAPVGDSGDQVELRFTLGGAEYLLLGRPRMVEPETSLIATGRGFTRCAFVAQDPRIYAGLESVTDPISLPQQAGGLMLPTLVPLHVGGTLVGGSAELVNTGTAATGMRLRIDGPLPNPLVILRAPSGSTQTIQFALTVLQGQWVEVDTAARTAFLNGLPSASVRGLAAWDMDPDPLTPGVSVLRLLASNPGPGTVTVTYRSAWW